MATELNTFVFFDPTASVEDMQAAVQALSVLPEQELSAAAEAIQGQSRTFLQHLESQGYSSTRRLRSSYSLLQRRIPRAGRLGADSFDTIIKGLVTDLQDVPEEVATNAFLKGAQALFAEVPTQLQDILVVPRKHHEISWNLERLGADYYVSPKFGVGKLLLGRMEMDGQDFVNVQFHSGAAYVPESSLTSTQAPEAYDVLASMITDVRYQIALSLAASVWNQLFPETVRKILDPERSDDYGKRIGGYKQTWRRVVKGWEVWNGEPQDRVTRGQPLHNLLSADELLKKLARELGIDPFVFAIHACNGLSVKHAIFGEPHPKGIKSKYDRIVTPSFLYALLLARPWEKRWQEQGVELPQRPNVLVAGNLHTTYYPEGAPRPHDLTDLYHAYRDGDAIAMERVTELLVPGARHWMGEKGGVIVPIPGCENAGNPNLQLAQNLAERGGWQTVNPWQERDPRVRGVDGHILHNKLQIVNHVLRFEKGQGVTLNGRRALFVDDCVMDGSTWMRSRELAIQAGATEAGLLSLTSGVRNPLRMNTMLGPQLMPLRGIC